MALSFRKSKVQKKANQLMESPSSNSDNHLQNLLAAVTDAILADENDIDRIVARYAVPRSEVQAFVNLIHRLHIAFVGVRPSPRFAQRLKLELMGVNQKGVIQRVRYLPPRVQIAAGVALIAGFMLLQRRRLRLPADGNEVSIAS